MQEHVIEQIEKILPEGFILVRRLNSKRVEMVGLFNHKDERLKYIHDKIRQIIKYQ